MNVKKRLATLMTVNLVLLGGVVVSVLTDGQTARGQTSVGAQRRYVMVAGEQGLTSRTGGRDNTVYVADLERGLVVALNYKQSSRLMEPIATRSLVQDIEMLEQRRGEPRR